MKTEKELGICVRCKKNKATIKFVESSLHFSHGFTEHICQECFNKMQREHPLWKVAVDTRNTEVKQAIESEEFVDKLIEWDSKNAKLHVKELWKENMNKEEFECFLNHQGAEMFDKVCYELMQKLGLGK